MKSEEKKSNSDKKVIGKLLDQREHVLTIDGAISRCQNLIFNEDKDLEERLDHLQIDNWLRELKGHRKRNKQLKTCLSTFILLVLIGVLSWNIYSTTNEINQEEIYKRDLIIAKLKEQAISNGVAYYDGVNGSFVFNHFDDFYIEPDPELDQEPADPQVAVRSFQTNSTVVKSPIYNHGEYVIRKKSDPLAYRKFESSSDEIKYSILRYAWRFTNREDAMKEKLENEEVVQKGY